VEHHDGLMQPSPPPVDRFPLAAVHAVLFLLGAALGVWGAFLIPLRLPGGTEGLSVLIAFGGNLAVGLGAARLSGSLHTAATPGIGWLVSVLVLGTIARPHDEVVLPGRLAADPGIGTVSTLFLLAGVVGAVLAVVLANRYTRRTGRPTPQG
jgi:hypothetical protein